MRTRLDELDGTPAPERATANAGAGGLVPVTPAISISTGDAETVQASRATRRAHHRRRSSSLIGEDRQLGDQQRLVIRGGLFVLG